jgi:hypothetical protein
MPIKRPAAASSIETVEGSGTLATRSPESVIVPVALRVWTVELPLQFKTIVPVRGTVNPTTPLAEMFSVIEAFWLKAD